MDAPPWQVQTLERCDPKFVRCIKPNRLKLPGIWEPDLVLTQLQYAQRSTQLLIRLIRVGVRYTGMLSTLEIQKAGYSSRVRHQQFWDQFRILDLDAAGENAVLCAYCCYTCG